MLTLDLKTLGEPDDLWGKFFLLWLKNLSQMNYTSGMRMRALDEAVVRLSEAVIKAEPKVSAELTDAVRALDDARHAWEEESKRSLEIAEALGVIAKRIEAQREGS